MGVAGFQVLGGGVKHAADAFDSHGALAKAGIRGKEKVRARPEQNSAERSTPADIQPTKSPVSRQSGPHWRTSRQLAQRFAPSLSMSASQLRSGQCYHLRQ